MPTRTTESSHPPSEKGQLANQIIEKLRQKLLDLSFKNPLIGFKHTERSRRYLRVIDELPDQLFDQLENGKTLILAPLPNPEKEREDEATDEFQEALRRFRAEDSEFLKKKKELGRRPSKKSEQELTWWARDRVRAIRGMDAVNRILRIPAIEHAKAIGLNPSFDLPPAQDPAKPEHQDNNVQTLLFPDELESRLNTIREEERLSETETGINTLHLAFGFLEFYESEASDAAYYAPLLLYPVHLEREVKKGTFEFRIESRGEGAVANPCIRAKLLKEHNITLPDVDEETTPEAYFELVQTAVREKKNWKVRRQITLGFFRFAKLVIYEDLAENNWLDGLGNHDIIGTLCTNTAAGDSSFAPDYPIDQPELSRVLPPLITNADISQSSAILDVLKGKNLVIEGPPGTGKSQTITNIIAAALERGQRVLFLAEKLAALRVVKNRLDNAGLGQFCFELHSNKTNKFLAIQSLDQALKARSKADHPRDYETLLVELQKVKGEVTRYVSALNQVAGDSGSSLHALLWEFIRLHGERRDLFNFVSKLVMRDSTQLTKLDREEKKSFLRTLEACGQEALAGYASPHDHPWHGIAGSQLSVFEEDGFVEQINSVVSDIDELLSLKKRIPLMERLEQTRLKGLEELCPKLLILIRTPRPNDATIFDLVKSAPEADAAQDLLKTLGKFEDLLGQARESFETAQDLTALDYKRLHSLLSIAKQLHIEDKAVSDLASLEREFDAEVADTKKLADFAVSVAKPFGVNTTAAELNPLVQAMKASADVPSHVIASRSEALLKLDAIPLLQQCQKQVDRLAAAKAKLEAQYDFSRIPDPKELTELAHTLKDAGFWGFLKPRVRLAKNQFRGFLLSNSQFNAQQMARALFELARHKKDLEDFQASSPLKELAGTAFQGLNTDIAQLLSVAHWAEIVRVKTPADNDLALKIRHILLTASPDQHDLFRRLVANPLFERLLTFSQMSHDVAIESEHQRASEGLTALKELKEELTPLGLRGDFQIKDLSELANLLSSLQKANAKLHAHSLFFLTSTKDSDAPLEQLRQALTFRAALIGALLNPRLEELLVTKDGVDRFLPTEKEVAELQDQLQKVKSSVTQLSTRLENLESFVGKAKDFFDVDLAPLCERLKVAGHSKEQLRPWVEFCQAREAVVRSNLGDLINAFEEQRKPYQKLDICFDLLYLHSILGELFRRNPVLEKFSGLMIDELRSRFRQLDERGIALYRQKLAADLAQTRIPGGVSSGRARDLTQLALIRNEISKKMRHLPLRELIGRAGEAIQALKPCFMMSPLSVAQYLKPGGPEFDLIVMDEASQLRPEDALGAIGRGKQLVVVGDPKQLPPSNFFLNSDDSVEEEDLMESVDQESILDQALKCFQPARRLRWHYRSRHQSLIAYSNREFYDSDLVVFPSPHREHEDLGVKLVHVDGVYNESTNLIEAQELVRHVQQFVRKHPDLSLGVVAVNRPQTDLIYGLLNELAKSDPEYEAYVSNRKGTIEEFFIKNLENVQGDERDVIFISTVYGKNNDGVFHQRFGPINSPTGHRRLNVLFTRAKNRLVIFSSIDPDWIQVGAGGHRGTKVFKDFLAYAKSGILSQPTPGGNETESDFELFVKRNLEAAGYLVDCQIGVAGYRIDLGVRHPKKPGAYMLGIECDGATYHSSASVRDRDKTRQGVLIDLKWAIYRIWSTDWFRSPEREMGKLLNRLKALEAESSQN